MARTAAGAALTQQHRQRQLALRAAVIRDLTLLWPLWDLEDFETFDRFVAASVPLIRARNRDSSGIAANYFRAFRTVEGIDGDASIQIADRPQTDTIVSSMRATGLAGTATALKAGKSPQAARQVGFVRMSGAASRHVQNGGRQTIIDSTRNDSRAKGWARVTSGSPCAFCAMLASRGPVFRESGTADFKPHDHCGCHPEPHYDGAEWPGRSREFREKWDEAQQKAQEAGELKRGTDNDALNAFRRHYQTSAT